MKNIVLLSDGTGNSAAKLFRTNVWRFYQLLDRSRPDQVVYYDDGVGSSTFKPIALFGGAFGWGLKRNILNLYIQLCRTYQDGDRVYGLGFSRGAFTIRVLIRLVLTEGLVANDHSGDDLRRKARCLYRQFRERETPRGGLVFVARKIRDFLLWPFNPGEIITVKVPNISFVGLWDTVDAYGMPIEEFKVGIDRYLWPIALNDSYLDGRIDKACHALSLDDKRLTFHPLFWDEVCCPCHSSTDDEKLTQVWFAGSHSNVGGGYPDDSLSNVPLKWMVTESERFGLRFDEPALAALTRASSPYGKMYDSRAGFGAFYRYSPRRLDLAIDKHGSAIFLPKIHHSVIDRMILGPDSYAPLNLPSHFSIVKDIASTCGQRARRNNLESLDCSSSNEFQSGACSTVLRLEDRDSRSAELTWSTVWWRQVAYFASVFCCALILLALWDSVNARLISASIQMTLGVPVDAIDELVGHSLSTVTSVAWSIVRPTILGAADIGLGFAPQFLIPYTHVIRKEPGAFLALSLLLCATLAWGALLDRRIHDRAYSVWHRERRGLRYAFSIQGLRWRGAVACSLFAYGIIGLLNYQSLIIGAFVGVAFVVGQRQAEWLYPSIAFLVAMFLLSPLVFVILPIVSVWWAVWTFRQVRNAMPNLTEIPSFSLFVAKRFRNSSAASKISKFYYKTLVPGLFAAVLAATLVSATNKSMFNALTAAGLVCGSQSPRISFRVEERTEWIVNIQNGCTYLPYRLDQGTRYKMTLTPFSAWSRQGLRLNKELDGEGFWTPWFEQPSWLLYLPFRRMFGQPWYKPIIQVSGDFFDQYPMGSDGTLVEFTPQSSRAALYFYINDAVIGIPWLWDISYGYNNGLAVLSIQRVSESKSPMN